MGRSPGKLLESSRAYMTHGPRASELLALRGGDVRGCFAIRRR